MNGTGSSYLLDSSIWLSYFYAESEKAKRIIESKEALFTSVLSLFEIKRKLLMDGRRNEDIKRTLEFVKERSIIIDLSEALVEKAAELSAEKSLHAIDSLIYTSALEAKAILVTSDPDFKGIEKVQVI